MGIGTLHAHDAARNDNVRALRSRNSGVALRQRGVHLRERLLGVLGPGCARRRPVP